MTTITAPVTAAAGFAAPYPSVKAALQALSVAVPARTGMPVLRRVRIDHDGDDAVLTAYDYETAVSVRLQGAATGGAATSLVAHDEVTRVIAAAAKGEPKKVTDGLAVAVTGDGAVSVGDFTVPTRQSEDVADAPDLPSTGGVVATLPAQSFIRAARRMIVTAGRDEALPALMHVQCVIDSGTVTMFSSDRYRAATSVLRADTAATTTVHLPVAALDAALKHLTGDEVTIRSQAGATTSLTSGAVTVTMMDRGDFDFPRLSQIIDGDRPLTARIAVTALLPAAKKAAALSKALYPDQKGERRVTFEWSGDGLTVKPLTSDPSRTKGVDVDVESTGDLPALAFVPEQLLDALTVMPADGTLIIRSTEHSFKPVEFTADGDDSYRLVVQPVRLGGVD